MTTIPTTGTPPAATDSRIRSGVEVEEPGEDSPRARRARAREIVTTRVLEIRAATRRPWWMDAQPMSMREAWEAGQHVDSRRVPLRSRGLVLAWRWANRTERLVFLAVAAPFAGRARKVRGPVLWLSARPSRRLVCWLFVAVFAAWTRKVW